MHEFACLVLDTRDSYFFFIQFQPLLSIMMVESIANSLDLLDVSSIDKDTSECPREFTAAACE
jgi:hypothetical protein